MKKYFLIVIVFILSENANFAQKQPEGNKKMDSTVLKMIKENSKLIKEQKDKPSRFFSVQDKKFTLFVDVFMDRFWRLNPEWATSVGYHFYDSLLIVPNPAQFETELTFYTTQQQKIQKFPFDSLNDLNKIDYKILENELNKYIWQIRDLKSYEWNPSYYNVGGAFSYLISENYEPLIKRVNSFNSRAKMFLPILKLQNKT